jgi:hypothetical protein
MGESKRCRNNVDYTFLQKWLDKRAELVAPPGHVGYQFDIPRNPSCKLIVLGPVEVLERVKSKDDGTGDIEIFVAKLSAEPELLSQLRFLGLAKSDWYRLRVPGSAPDYFRP